MQLRTTKKTGERTVHILVRPSGGWPKDREGVRKASFVGKTIADGLREIEKQYGITYIVKTYTGTKK